MMQHANTLYITTQGAYLSRDHATLCVRVEKETRLKVPLHHLEGVVCFGRIGVSHGVYEAPYFRECATATHAIPTG
jgi:CRISPR-associated protein Cas1